jgi:hypothetical protein
MSQALHLGISLGLLFLGVGIILGISELVGVIFIIIGLAWTLLSFISNPLRKRFWIDDKVVALVDDAELGSNKTVGFPPEFGNRIIRVGVRINTIHERKIRYIKLKLSTKFINAFKPKGYYLYFDIPKTIPAGRHKAQIRVYTNDGFSKSRSFQVDIPTISSIAQM